MASATKTRTSQTTRTSRRRTVGFDELANLISRRSKSSYPADARTERQYWLRQIKALLGEES